MTPEERNRFKEIESQMSNMRKHSHSIEGKLDKVIAILTGDEFGTSEGIVRRLAKVEERTKKIETLKNRATWMVLGASIPSGYGIWEFLKKIFPPMLIVILVQ